MKSVYPSLPEMSFEDLVEKLNRSGIHIESPSLSSSVGEATLIQSQRIEYIKVIEVTKKTEVSNGGIVTTATGRQYGGISSLTMIRRYHEILYIPKGKRKQRSLELESLGSFVILAQEWQEIDQEHLIYEYRSPQGFATLTKNTRNILYARF